MMSPTPATTTTTTTPPATLVCQGRGACGKEKAFRLFGPANGRWGKHNLCNACRAARRRKRYARLRDSGVRRCPKCKDSKDVSRFSIYMRDFTECRREVCMDCEAIVDAEN